MSKNTIKTFVLLAFMGGLIMLIGSFFGQQGLIFGAIIAFAMVGGSYWFSDTIAIKAARAQPVSEQEMPDYYRIVRELTQRLGMPMPKHRNKVPSRIKRSMCEAPIRPEDADRVRHLPAVQW